MPNEQYVPELEQLRLENVKLREDLGISYQSSKRTETFERLEKENEMLKNQHRILQYCRHLLETDDGMKECLFALQFFHSIPRPLWTSTVEAKISYWNDYAEKTYNYPRKKAIGRDFIDLFVSEPEREQAAEDLISIIFGEKGDEYYNMCKDKDKNGRPVILVTCCFPVLDVRKGEIAQAELSFDLRQLPELESDLNSMYERHRKNEEEARELKKQREVAVIRSLIEELFIELRQYCSRERALIEKRIETNRGMVDGRQSTAAEKETHRLHLDAHQKALVSLERWELGIQRDIALCNTIDDHTAMKAKIREGAR